MLSPAIPFDVNLIALRAWAEVAPTKDDNEILKLFV